MTGSARRRISAFRSCSHARRPDLKTRLPLLGAAIEAGRSISYTQWEAWLAIYHGKALVIAAPEPGVARDPKFAPTAHSKAAQADHLKRLREIDRHPEVKFANADNLVARIFASAVIDALVKAAATPTRKPRNFPYASLGPLFLGRDKALDHLRAALLANKNAAVAAIALHGLGGVGKRRLAVEYAWRREADYSALLFVRADNPATLNANLAGLAGAEVLNLPAKETKTPTKIDAALGWLENHPTWLMILDNVGDEEGVAAVSELMARLKAGHVIVTSRASNFPAYIRTLELGALGEDEAARYSWSSGRRASAPSRPTTRLRRASSRASSAAWRSAWSRPAPISRASASASPVISRFGGESAMAC